MRTSSTKDCSKFKRALKEIFRICERALGALFWVVSVAFAQPSKELIQEMQAMRALTVRMYEEDLIKDFTGFEDCKDFYFYKDAMERHAALFFSLSLDFMDKIPLLQALQPKTPQDREFLRVFKAYESLQLFAILRSYIPSDFDCSDVSPPLAFDATQVTQDFLEVLNLLFAPLLQARKENLNLWDTLKSQTMSVEENDLNALNRRIKEILDDMPNGQKHDPSIQPSLHTFKQLNWYEGTLVDYEEESSKKFVKAFLGVDLEQQPATLLNAYYNSRLKVLWQDIKAHLP